MSTALAYSGQIDFRRARLLRQAKPRPARQLRPWSEVAVAGTPLQATTKHPPHIKRSALVALFVVAVAIHSGIVWYFDTFGGERTLQPQKNELNIELVRPPKPPEPPKPEPPKTPPKPQPPQAQQLPQIQQSEAPPATVGESTEPPVAVAPVVNEPPPPPAPITAPIGRAGYLNNPPPEYPPQAVRQNWQGTVELRVRVLANGTVESVAVKKSSGRKILDDEAMRTVKLWLFTPSKQGDTAIDGWATVPINFALDQ